MSICKAPVAGMTFAFSATSMTVVQRNSSILPPIVFVLVFACGVRAQVDRPELSRRGNNDRTEDKSVLGSIRGRVLLPDGNYVSSNVRVTLQTFRDTVTTIYTDNQGQFEFADLVPGNYQLEIDPTDREHFEPSHESVQVFKAMPSIVSFTLKTKEANKAKSTTATVSIAELAGKVPSNARKEFDKATQASQKGSTDEAIAHLRKAIALAPTFVMAHNDLGVQLLAQGKLDEAAEALRKAVSLDPNAFNPSLNYGIVLVHLHRFAEANESLSRALTLQPKSPAAHFYSGLAQKGLDNVEDATHHWKLAYEAGGVEFAVALFYLGETSLTEGDRASALQYFEQYLSLAPDAANAEQARRIIAKLRQL